MTDEIKGVAEAIKAIHTGFDAYKQANDERLKQIEAKGSADPLTEAKLAKMEAAITDAQAVADEAVLASKRAARVVVDDQGNPIDVDAALEAKAASWRRHAGGFVGEMQARQMTGESLKSYTEIMEGYFRKGPDSLDHDERKALSVGGDATGGYTVNPDMSGAIVTKIFETSPMRAYAAVQVISKDALEGLFDLNEVGYGWVAETAARPVTSTPNFGAWRIAVHEMYANPSATQQMLDDPEINIEQWLAGKVADRFARAEAESFVTGDGVGQPRGFLTYPAGVTNPGQIPVTNSGVNGGLAAAPNGGDVLLTALYNLKGAYRSNASWFTNRATTALLRKTKDSDGAYLWSPGIAAGQPATLLGYPVASFEDMPDPATGSLSIAVGDMRSAYQIVDRVGIRTLRDPFSAKPFVEFYSTKRVGGAVINFEALQLIKLAS